MMRLMSWPRYWTIAVILLQTLVCGTLVQAYTANKVWFEFRQDGKFRVYVNYTIPALKEFRESYVDFLHRKEAEKFYWALVRGGEFTPPDPQKVEFPETPDAPDPW